MIIEQVLCTMLNRSPKSISKLFPQVFSAFSKSPFKITQLLTHSFALLLLTGAEVVLARTPQGKALGYCIYTSAARTRSRAPSS